ncbi:hypothetical protein [Tsukamurella paurometabola]
MTPYGRTGWWTPGRRGVDLATEHPAAMAEIAGAVRAGLEARGWAVTGRDLDPLTAWLVVGDPATGAEYRADLKEGGAVGGRWWRRQPQAGGSPWRTWSVRPAARAGGPRTGP